VLRKLSLQATFDELRAERTRVVTAPRSDPFDVEPTVDVRVLVGVERRRFERELGRPESCDGSDCSDATEWHYSFYYLPDGWLGGGTALFLSFDGSGRCVGAAWGGFK
jgi:hypothetical protein